MFARLANLDCPMRSSSELQDPTLSSARPVAGTKAWRIAPAQSRIAWRAVAAAGGVAWMLVAGLVLVVWVTNHRPSTVRATFAPLKSDPPEARPALESTNHSEGIAQAGQSVAAAPAEKASFVQPVSFMKAPVSPPLSVAEEQSVTREPELPTSELGLGEEAAQLRTYGTQVAFVNSPAEAARKALKERKLLFVLHLSGNFEDKQFT